MGITKDGDVRKNEKSTKEVLKTRKSLQNTEEYGKVQKIREIQKHFLRYKSEKLLS